MPIISVCLITYNREKYLKEAMDSVLSQSFSDWELIIVDNGSTDNSVDGIIKPYISKDSRILKPALVVAAKFLTSVILSMAFILENKVISLFKKEPLSFSYLQVCFRDRPRPILSRRRFKTAR